MGGRETVDPRDRGFAPTISNASPLIALSQIGRLDLLHALFGDVFVPTAVVREAPRVAMPSWLVERSAGPLPLSLSAAELGRGETETIALALRLGAARVILDERRATRHARSLGLPVIGTLGVLLLAKTEGHIPSVRPAIDDLMESGFYLSQWVIADALATAGEARDIGLPRS